MWRNLRVSGKLSLGFGLIVLVFLVSVLVMWRSIATVRSASTTLAEGVAVASEQVNALNSQTYEMLMAMRLVQYEETPEAISEFRARLEQVLKIQADVEALHEARPALLAPIHVVNTVIPLSKEYAALVEQSLVAIGKKQDALASVRRDGQATTNIVSEFMTVLHGHMKDRIQNWAGAAELGALADAMSLGDTLMQDSMALRRDIWQFVAAFGRNAEVRQAVIDRVNNMRGQIEAIEPLVASFPEGKSKIDSLFANLASYESQVAEFVKFSDEVERFREARAPLMNSLNHENTVAADMATARVKEVSEENVEELGTALLVMSVSTAVAVVLGVFIVFFIARSISRPLNTIVGLAKRAGDGDLSIQKEDFGYDGRDEMGGMIVALSAMLESQRAAMKHVVKAAGDLSAGAGDLAANAETTSLAVEGVKTSIHQVGVLSESNGTALEESNAGVEEVSAGADTVAHSATESAAFISQTAATSNQAVRMVSSLIEGLHNVDKNSKESEEKTRQLFVSVENVSSFVSVITGIADQTNLLALNAAIEAARAGEVGRGFAVVAEEVRKLAEESGRAAQNVNEIIGELQRGAQASIDATSEAGRLLVTTLEQAGQALQALDGALDQMEKASESIQNIAAVAEEQAASSKEVAGAIDSATKASAEMIGAVADIDRVAGATTASTENVAKKAEEFMTVAQDLLERVSMFRVLSREELADEILSKIQAHRDYGKKLYAIAETCQPMPIQINPRNCALGILMTSATPPEGFEHWWTRIHEPHNRFHELGAKILKVVNDDKKSMAEKRTEAAALAREGETLSKVVVKLLEDAAADIRSSASSSGRSKLKALPAAM